MAEPEKPKFKIEGSTSTTTQSALELIKNETDVTEHKLDAAIDDAAKQKVAEKIEKRVQEAKDKYKKGEGEIILITKEKLANFRKQINIEAKDSDEVVGTTNPSDTGTPKLSDTEITETIKTHLEENGTPVTPTETPPAPPESATTPAPSPETPTTPATPGSTLGNLASRIPIIGGLFGGGAAAGASNAEGGGFMKKIGDMIKGFIGGWLRSLKGFTTEASETAFTTFEENLVGGAKEKINTLVGNKWIFNTNKGAATAISNALAEVPSEIKLKDLAKDLSPQIVQLGDGISDESVVNLINDYVANFQQQRETRQREEAQRKQANEQAETEKVQREFPLGQIIQSTDAPGIDFIRVSDKVGEKYTIIIRDTTKPDGDKYCKVTREAKDMKIPNLKTAASEAKKPIENAGLEASEKKLLCKADLKKFIELRGGFKYFVNWEKNENDETKHGFRLYQDVPTGKLADLKKSIEKAISVTNNDVNKLTLRLLDRFMPSVATLDGYDTTKTLAQLNGDTSPAPTETNPAAPESNPAEDAQRLAGYPLADVIKNEFSESQFIRVSGADTEGKYTFVLRKPSDSGDTYAKVRLRPGQLTKDGLKVLDKIQYTNIRNNRNYLESTLTPTERAQLARADIRNLLFNRKDFDYKPDAGDSKKYGEVTIGQLPDLLRFLEKGISYGKDDEEKKNARLGKVLVERIMLNLDQLKSTLGSEADNTTLNQIDGPSSSPEITPTPAEAAENEKIKNYPLETVKRIEGTKSDCIRISEKNASGKYTCIIRNSEGSNDTYAKIELNADEFNKTRLTEEVAKATTVQDSFLFGLRPPESTALIKAEFKNFYEKQTQEYRDTLKILKLRDSTTGYFFTRKLRESADGIVKNERNLRTQENAKESIGLIDRFISGSIYGNFYALVGGLREAEEVTLEDFYNLITNS